MQHLDELMMNIAQRHRPRRIQAVSRGQASHSRRQSHDPIASALRGSQFLTNPFIRDTSRSERHHASVVLGLGEKPEGRCGLDHSLPGLGDRH